MLKIFKSYVGKSSILDDFPFYEEREQSLKASRNHKPIPQTEMYRAYATGHVSFPTSYVLQILSVYSIISRHTICSKLLDKFIY